MDKSFRSDQSLRSAIYELIEQSYEDPTALITREFEHCDTLYLAENENDILVAFFMVAWETVNVGGEMLPTVYLGLSATSEDTKNTGIVRQLYSNFILVGARWEQSTGRRLLLWGTTATPSAFYAAQTLFAEVQPDMEGRYSQEAAEIALHLHQRMGISARVDGAHPFVLRNIATNTRYSQKELARIELIRTKKKFRLFDDLRISERDGDRLLLICRIPYCTAADGKHECSSD
jgi:hypothetical protein